MEVVCSSKLLNIKKTFDCGQCFRWNEKDGKYEGVTGNYPAVFLEKDGYVMVESDAPMKFWNNYFDLNEDYEAHSKEFEDIPYLKTCKEFGQGIRILRQDPWEALCSFIISQCNNIPRIKGIVEKLCLGYGEKKEFKGKEYSMFPKAEVLAKLKPDDLAYLRSGYRAPYIIDAARAVDSGDIDLDKLSKIPYKEAKKELLKLNGVGEKVANCAVLFGLHHMEAFPVDVWMKRALNENFPKDFDPETLGDFAGLAQQYIFYYARSNG